MVNCAGATRGGAGNSPGTTPSPSPPCARPCAAAAAAPASCRSAAARSTAQPARFLHGGGRRPRPGGPYGVSKLAATELVLGSGLDAVVLRVFSPAGPGTPPAPARPPRRGDAARHAVRRGRAEARRSRCPARLRRRPGRGPCRARRLALRRAGVINIGSGRAVRLRDAAAVLARVAGYGGVLHELDGPPGVQAAHGIHTTHATHTGHTAHTPHLRPGIGHPRSESDHHAASVAYPYPDGCGSWQQADVRTARDRLGWRPRINLEESLADIWMEAACRI
ncbi:reductase [Streptomyces sp. INA 01156]